MSNKKTVNKGEDNNFLCELQPTSLVQKVLTWATFIMMFALLYLIFMYAPVEKQLGIIQKIFYFHVGSAWTAFLAFGVVAFCSVAFLVKRKRIWDVYAGVSAELGVILCTFTLVSGMIWGKSAWNVWWAWEPRLTTTLILWFIYVAYIVIRNIDGPWDKKARLASVFGIIGFLDVPIVFMAIRWWNQNLHPLVLGSKGGGLDGKMTFTLVFATITFTLLYSVLLLKGVYVEKALIAVQQAKERLQDRLAS